MTPRASVAGRTAKEEEVFNAVRKYNEDLMKAKESGPDVAPPLPLKKKTSKSLFLIHVALNFCMTTVKRLKIMYIYAR